MSAVLLLGEAVRIETSRMHRYVVTAAQLLAPLVDPQGNASRGLDWCSQAAAAAGFKDAAAQIQASRIAVLLHHGQHGAAVQALKVTD